MGGSSRRDIRRTEPWPKKQQERMLFSTIAKRTRYYLVPTRDGNRCYSKREPETGRIGRNAGDVENLELLGGFHENQDRPPLLTVDKTKRAEGPYGVHLKLKQRL